MDKYYLRINGSTFGFLLKGYNEIKETDIEISKEDHSRFLELQTEGKQFRVRSVPTGTTLFDYLEEYVLETTVGDSLTLEERVVELESIFSAMKLSLEK